MVQAIIFRVTPVIHSHIRLAVDQRALQYGYRHVRRALILQINGLTPILLSNHRILVLHELRSIGRFNLDTGFVVFANLLLLVEVSQKAHIVLLTNNTLILLFFDLHHPLLLKFEINLRRTFLNLIGVFAHLSSSMDILN